mmetsp:Transcript_17545/g.24410  ORF Transcript_17545/g.24410 Transcript_17545/m.24410 type:complete len:426 (-) Transcript_17545:152-1429(-)|eukprot:CAMPEP_0201501712 /NCGR_PEP_ID=MMETSP0151_2-20130828/83738_1 /ASSEMBLY_ACC=CAM_ASM_000257 /TAXON_ID=200890 /ORGANISM="Paramoeba atlantica, Strain 621/1 / CCAP 1560/9" /LENGTH=425 /DNA_ID=CAMNT_0047895239 /DNA_START=2681 /DNA_END=3958 /DNA_ORIENTATION=+
MLNFFSSERTASKVKLEERFTYPKKLVWEGKNLEVIFEKNFSLDLVEQQMGQIIVTYKDKKCSESGFLINGPQEGGDSFDITYCKEFSMFPKNSYHCDDISYQHHTDKSIPLSGKSVSDDAFLAQLCQMCRDCALSSAGPEMFLPRVKCFTGKSFVKARLIRNPEEMKQFMVNPRHSCNTCRDSADPRTDVIYRCLTCLDFDLCSGCFHKKGTTHVHHNFVELELSGDWPLEVKEVSTLEQLDPQGFNGKDPSTTWYCDGECEGAHSLTLTTVDNVRYRCKECYDMDLCEPCYLKNNHKHSSYTKYNFLQMERPTAVITLKCTPAKKKGLLNKLMGEGDIVRCNTKFIGTFNLYGSSKQPNLTHKAKLGESLQFKIGSQSYQIGVCKDHVEKGLELHFTAQKAYYSSRDHEWGLSVDGEDIYSYF